MMPKKSTKTNRPRLPAGKAGLDKLEKLLEEAGYVLRLEKGNFTSGYCILEHRKVVVINKFLDIEGRINVLSDILSFLKIDIERLSPASKKCYEAILQNAEKNEILHQIIEQEVLSVEEPDTENENT